MMVYDVTTFGAGSATNCDDDTRAIQAAIDAAHADPGGTLASGGTVYIPRGQYCISHELRAYPNITIKGASLGGLNGGSASIIYTSPTFGATPPSDSPLLPNGMPYSAMLRLDDRSNVSYPGYDLAVEDLTFDVWTATPNVVGVDFSGVWYGSIRGVSVAGVPEGSGTPRVPASHGSIGFIFSDIVPGSACYGNIIERTGVYLMETGYLFQTHNNMSLNTLTNFWITDVVNGVWFDHPGDGATGLSLRDGYMTTTVSADKKKAFKYTGGGRPTIQMMNIQYEASAPPPNQAGFGFDGGSDLATSQLTQLAVFGGDALEPIVLDGDVTLRSVTEELFSANDGNGCGASSACPCGWPNDDYPPAHSLSFWARIAPGVTLNPGRNGPFVFYTAVGADGASGAHPSTSVGDDLYFTTYPKDIANVTHMFQLTVKSQWTCPYGTWHETYSVYLTLPDGIQPITLDTDFVFFIEARMTKAMKDGSTCNIHPPLSVPAEPPQSCPG
jgi:hypothetical protein